MPIPKLAPRTKKIVRGVGTVLLIGVTVAANVAVAKFGKTLNSWVSTDYVDVSDTEYNARMAQDEKLAEEEEAEGAVLLQNKDNVLPFSKDVDKVNVFGWSSTQWVASGSGSGQVAGKTTGLLDALVDYGISYNEELTDMYKRYSSARPRSGNGSLNSFADDYCQLVEPSIQNRAWYTKGILDNAKSYSDAAIVVISRVAGESIDCPGTQSKVSNTGYVTKDTNRSYLELSTQELDLLTYVGENYDKVVVLVNSTNAMELGPIESIPGVDACLLVGCTGSCGAKAIPKLLWGDVNPSGRTSDTYAYDLTSAASYPNSGTWGIGTYTNSKGHYPADGTLNGNVGTISAYDGVSYYDYQEGIYVGYRWYETADEEGFWGDVDNEYGTGYDGVVQYPFGYGLSYTNFSWEVVDSSIEDGDTISEDSQISVTVRVTNTGQNAGKDVVELYYTAPYYTGGIQKSSVELAAFAKTKLLVPGESTDVTLTFAARDMASYDCYDENKDGFAGYELDAGTYTISLRHDAHMPDKAAGSTISVVLPRTAELATDATTGAAVENRFTGDSAEDGVSIDGSNAGYPLTWLDRASFTATYPKKTPNRSMTTAVIEKNLYHAEDAEAAIKSTDETVKYGTSGTKALGSDGSLTELGYALGLDYGNPQWESLLNQMSQAEQEDLVLHGYSNTADITSIGKPQTKEVDGPSQVGSFNQLKYGTGFSNGTVLAQTWNTELAGRIGEALGAEASYIGVDGIYAPSANLHRSAFGGRNYEYLSEDPLLTGKMAAAEVKAIKNTGTYCFVKHLICNDQDTMRDGLYEWMTEQTLRELYLEPFRILVEEGGATGMMSSYNRIGAVWAGGSEALLTGVLRNEWGFKGAVITDYADHHTYMNADQMLRAGGDLYMDGIMRDGTFVYETTSATFQQDLRRAAKDVLYVWLNARAQNLQYNETAEKTFVRPIKHAGIPIISIAVGALDAAILTGAVAGGWRKWKKKHEGQEFVSKTPSE